MKTLYKWWRFNPTYNTAKLALFAGLLFGGIIAINYAGAAENQNQSAAAPEEEVVSTTIVGPVAQASDTKEEAEKASDEDIKKALDGIRTGTALFDGEEEVDEDALEQELFIEGATCTFLGSKPEMNEWIDEIRAEAAEADVDFEDLFNERYDATRAEYWGDPDNYHAARNGLLELENQRPFVADLVRAIYGEDAWNTETPGDTWVNHVLPLLWTAELDGYNEWTNTYCENDGLTPEDEQYRTVHEAGKIARNANSEDNTLLVDVIMPSIVNERLTLARGAAVDIRIEQDGNTYRVIRVENDEETVTVVEIGSDSSVPLKVTDPSGEVIVVQGLNATLCGNFMRPVPPPTEVKPEVEVRSTTTTTTQGEQGKDHTQAPPPPTFRLPTTTTTSTPPPETTTTTTQLPPATTIEPPRTTIMACGPEPDIPDCDSTGIDNPPPPTTEGQIDPPPPPPAPPVTAQPVDTLPPDACQSESPPDYC